MKIRVLVGRVFGDDYFISIAFPDGRVAVLSLTSNNVVIRDGGGTYRAELVPADSLDIDYYLPLEGEIRGGVAKRVVEGGKMYIVVGDRTYEVGKVFDIEI